VATGRHQQQALGHGGLDQIDGADAVVTQQQSANQAPAPLAGQQLRPLLHPLLQALLQLLAPLLHVLQQSAPLQFTGHREGSAARQGIAAKSAGVVPRLEHGGLVFHSQGADREAAAEALGGGEGIGLDAQLLVAPKGAAAAHAHLHLITDQQQLALIAELA